MRRTEKALSARGRTHGDQGHGGPSGQVMAVSLRRSTRRAERGTHDRRKVEAPNVQLFCRVARHGGPDCQISPLGYKETEPTLVDHAYRQSELATPPEETNTIPQLSCFKS